MELTEIGALQIAKRVDAILHVPGNYRGGVLEMAVVIDSSETGKRYISKRPPESGILGTGDGVEGGAHGHAYDGRRI